MSHFAGKNLGHRTTAGRAGRAPSVDEALLWTGQAKHSWKPPRHPQDRTKQFGQPSRRAVNHGIPIVARHGVSWPEHEVIYLVGGIHTLLKNISQWEGLSHILWTNNPNVPKHQPVMVIDPETVWCLWRGFWILTARNLHEALQFLRAQIAGPRDPVACTDRRKGVTSMWCVTRWGPQSSLIVDNTLEISVICIYIYICVCVILFVLYIYI